VRFFENPEKRDREFLKILSSGIKVFGKSSVTQSGFLENSQQVARIFL